MNALWTVPGNNDVINVHELMQVVKGLKNEAVGNDKIRSEVFKFASELLLTMMSIFLSGCMLAGKLLSTLMHVVIIKLLKCKSKDPAGFKGMDHQRKKSFIIHLREKRFNHKIIIISASKCLILGFFGKM